MMDEAISVVQQRALELCEHQLLSARGRLSTTQSSITRRVIEAVVDRLLAVPATRDDAALLAYLFEPAPPVSERSQDRHGIRQTAAGAGIGPAVP
jgi:hypothetical protein